MGYSERGMLGMWDFWHIECLGHEMFKMWNVWDVGCSSCGLLRM